MAGVWKAIICLMCLGVTFGRKVNIGDSFTTTCSVTYLGSAVTQIFKGETAIKIFKTTTTFQPWVLSNDTEINPRIAGWTDRYSVTRDSSGLFSGLYRLSIKDVQLGDHGPWRCRLISSSGMKITESTMGFLDIEVPVSNLYWTTNTTPPDPLIDDPPMALEDGASVQVTLDNNFNGPDLFCVFITGITEPLFNMTFGKYGEDSSTMVDTKERGSFAYAVYGRGGMATVFKSAERFSPKFDSHSGEDDNQLYCRVETQSQVLEKSVNVQIRRKPTTWVRCDPYEVRALPGDKNVKLSCTIRNGNPQAQLTKWTSRASFNSVFYPSDTDPRYSVESQVNGPDSFTATLTLTEVKDDYFGPYTVHFSNELGEGTGGVFLNNGRSGSDALKMTPSLVLTLALGLLQYVRNR